MELSHPLFAHASTPSILSVHASHTPAIPHLRGEAETQDECMSRRCFPSAMAADKAVADQHGFDYFRDQNIPLLMRAVYGNKLPRMVVVIRDPVERLHSAYYGEGGRGEDPGGAGGGSQVYGRGAKVVRGRGRRVLILVEWSNHKDERLACSKHTTTPLTAPPTLLFTPYPHRRLPTLLRQARPQPDGLPGLRQGAGGSVPRV